HGAQAPAVRRSAPERDEALPVEPRRAQARSYRCMGSGIFAGAARPTRPEPVCDPPSVAAGCHCASHGVQVPAVRRSAPERDEALPVEPRRAQARSYRCTGSGIFAGAARPTRPTPDCDPPSVAAGCHCASHGAQVPAVRRSAPERDEALPVEPRRAQARSYRCMGSGIFAGAARPTGPEPVCDPPSVAAGCHCASHGAQVPAVRRSAPERDEALPVEPRRAQARSYGCMGSGTFAGAARPTRPAPARHPPPAPAR
ncbi:hypothetical protein FHY19_003433, partial [Xanthomonas arboricola]|nr:hypothetical protein [Xanthomonas sp. 4461]